jgi:hypothetical protein
VSIEELRARAAAMGNEFKRTTWVPWVVAGGLAACFGLMFAGLQAPVHRLGALVGIAAALYLVWQAGRLGRRRALDEGTPSVRVYAWHLARQRDATQVSVVTLVLMTMGSALASVRLDSTAAAALLSVLGPLGGGGVTAWYVHRFVRRCDRLLDELGKLP